MHRSTAKITTNIGIIPLKRHICQLNLEFTVTKTETLSMYKSVCLCVYAVAKWIERAISTEFRSIFFFQSISQMQNPHRTRTTPTRCGRSATKTLMKMWGAINHHIKCSHTIIAQTRNYVVWYASNYTKCIRDFHTCVPLFNLSLFTTLCSRSAKNK